MSAFIGLFLHAIGGLAAASFYTPLKRVQHWKWECFYLVMGFFAWIVVPLSVVLLTVPDFIKVLLNCQLSDLGWTFFFGLLWGIGATTFGLTMRYLGMALGMAICLGFCAIW